MSRTGINLTFFHILTAFLPLLENRESLSFSRKQPVVFFRTGQNTGSGEDFAEVEGILSQVLETMRQWGLYRKAEVTWAGGAAAAAAAWEADGAASFSLAVEEPIYLPSSAALHAEEGLAVSVASRIVEMVLAAYGCDATERGVEIDAAAGAIRSEWDAETLF